MYTKYITALKLMDDVITARDITASRDEQSAACNAAWDIAFTYIHANFAEPISAGDATIFAETGVASTACIDMATLEKELARCKPIIDGTYPAGNGAMETVLRSIPPILLDVVWPIGIARLLLRDYGLPIRHRTLTTFPEFHRRYGYMILGC